MLAPTTIPKLLEKLKTETNPGKIKRLNEQLKMWGYKPDDSDK